MIPSDALGGQAPLEPLNLGWARKAGVELALLRLDLLDPLISGNKAFKLSGYLAQRAARQAPGLISLGGAHSNHLHALAAAGHRCGFRTVGLVRGEPATTPTVKDVLAFGMRLHWLSYGEYRARYQLAFWERWQAEYPGFVHVPEGGESLLGALGCVPLVRHVVAQLAPLGWDDFDGWWLAAGTGTTAAGLVIGEAGRRQVHMALAGPERHGVGKRIAALLAQHGQADQGYRLVPACRHGFGQSDPELLSFMAMTEQETGVALEPVYTAKALMALRQSIEAAEFAPGTRLVVVHTGGLQGRRAAVTPVVE